MTRLSAVISPRLSSRAQTFNGVTAVPISTPHLNPLPKGEGECAELSVSLSFLLPWGEGQDEGLSRKRAHGLAPFARLHP